MINQEIEREEIRITQELLKDLHALQIDVLENLYANSRVITFQHLKKIFSLRYNVSDKTLRRRIDKLEEMGLIESIKSYEKLIRPIPKIKDELLHAIQTYRTSVIWQ